MQGKHSHLFGPVPSRRLGRSLGIDPIPFKICTFDCIYCQLGRTTHKTLQRREYVPTSEIIDELHSHLSEHGNPDYITLSGSGEPVLHSGIGEIIRAAKEMSNAPVAVLTNGSLLFEPDVRRDLMDADVVLPSLDAATEVTFVRINRPADGLSISRIVEGIAQFRREFSGEVWLEIMLVRNVNDAEDELLALRDAIRFIQPHRVQVNTVVRPPAEIDAHALSREELNRVARIIGHGAEIIATPTLKGSISARDAEVRARIMSILQRRPCTLEDIVIATGMHRNELLKHIHALAAEGSVVQHEHDGRIFFHARNM